VVIPNGPRPSSVRSSPTRSSPIRKPKAQKQETLQLTVPNSYTPPDLEKLLPENALHLKDMLTVILSDARKNLVPVSKPFEEIEFTEVPPADADDVPLVVETLTRKVGPNELIRLFVKWRLLQSLQDVQPAVLQKHVTDLVKVYKSLPDSTPPDRFGSAAALPRGKTNHAKKSRRSAEPRATVDKDTRAKTAVFYNTLVRRTLLDMTHILLATRDQSVLEAVTLRTGRLCDRQDLTVCELVKTVNQQMSKPDPPWPGASTEFLSTERTRLAAKYKNPLALRDYTRLQSDRSQPVRKIVYLPDILKSAPTLTAQVPDVPPAIP